jgi:hypothetical protein
MEKLRKRNLAAEAEFTAKEDDEVDVYIKSLARASSERERTRSQGTYAAMGGKRDTRMRSRRRVAGDPYGGTGGASGGWGGTGTGMSGG